VNGATSQTDIFRYALADLGFLYRWRLRSDIGSQRPQFQYHHTNTQAPPDEQAGTCVSAQPMAAHTIDSLFNNQRNFRMSNAMQSGFSESFQAIATAYGDYTKKSFEDNKSFVEKLAGVRSFDKAVEIQTQFAKSAFETFVTESQKIGALYTDLAKQSYKPFGSFVTKATSTE
jgi:ribosomal protein S17E